jgi:hypothetical protein
MTEASLKSREVRFGLVMYGGVSLAIYINGVSQEFCRIVRGNGIYGFLKALSDSDVVVDIVSGSSAGGINGIFLSYALANGLDFSGMAQLWRDKGGIEELLRQPDADPENCQSLLDSEGYFEPQLLNALQTLSECSAEAKGDYDPRKNEIDLFVTGTNVDGEVYTVIDDDGHAIDVKDHRTVFWLKHRSGRNEQFDRRKPHTDAALAKLARLTSCFPAAFAPVHVEPGSRRADGTADSADAHLRKWGNFSNERYFLDGGVLNNKPFSHTIEAIFRRTQVRPVERQLAYVEPDPDYFPGQEVRAPSFFQATTEGAYGIKGYESIADDLYAISQHNAAVDRYWYLCRELRGGKLPKCSKDWIQSGGGEYNGVVLPSNKPDVPSVDASVPNPQPDQPSGNRSVPPQPPKESQSAQRIIYARSRFSGMAIRSLKGILTRDGDREQIRPELREQAADLVKSLSDLDPAVTAQNGNVLSDDESLFRFDVYFRLRRLYHVCHRIGEELRRSTTKPDPDWTKLWEELNLHIKTAEIVRFGMEYVLDHAKIGWEARKPIEVWNDVRWYLEAFLDVTKGCPAPGPDLEAFHKDLLAHAARVSDRPRGSTDDLSKPTDPFPGLLSRIDRGALGGVDKYATLRFKDTETASTNSARDEFVEYVQLDAVLFPLEFVSSLESKDRIKILRISPRDAQSGFSRRRVEDKLAGDALAHFGGFLKRSWRSNDMLWGRLDTVCELFRALLSPKRLEEVTKNDYLRRQLRARMEEAFSKPVIVEKWFGSRCAAVETSEVHAWISDLLGDDEAKRRPALEKERVDVMVERLIEMAQLEILYESVPTVIEDAVTQQAEWNQYLRPQRTTKLDKRKVLAEAAKLRLTGEPEKDDVARCRLFADRTDQDREEIRSLWMASQPKRKDDWDRPARDGDGTYGQRITSEAVVASHSRASAAFERFRPTEGFVDPLVASRAAEHYAAASVSDLSEPANAARPRETRMGRFFLRQYRVGSEDPSTGIPWLISLEIAARAGLVLRNCVLGALSKERRQRIVTHTLFRIGFDWPLRLVYWIARYERQKPGRVATLWTTLVGASLASLITIRLSKGSVLLDGTLPALWRFVVFLAVPLGVVYAQWCRMMVAWQRKLVGAVVVVGLGAFSFWKLYGNVGAKWMFILAGTALVAFLAGGIESTKSAK